GVRRAASVSQLGRSIQDFFGDDFIQRGRLRFRGRLEGDLSDSNRDDALASAHSQFVALTDFTRTLCSLTVDRDGSSFAKLLCDGQSRRKQGEFEINVESQRMQP